MCCPDEAKHSTGVGKHRTDEGKHSTDEGKRSTDKGKHSTDEGKHSTKHVSSCLKGRKCMLLPLGAIKAVKEFTFYEVTQGLVYLILFSFI